MGMYFRLHATGDASIRARQMRGGCLISARFENSRRAAVIPAEAGIQSAQRVTWTPAFAGVTADEDEALCAADAPSAQALRNGAEIPCFATNNVRSLDPASPVFEIRPVQ